MASSSNITNPLFSVQITEKLNKSNHVLWQAQVLTTISSDRLEGHITGKTGAPEAEVEEKGTDGKFVKVSNPAYEEWFATDQQILGFLFMSDTKDMLTQIAVAKTAAQAWSAVEAMFTAQMRARSMNVRLTLTTTKKGSMTITEYFGKMKALSNEMAAAGKPLDDEVVTNILSGLELSTIRWYLP